MTMISHHQNIVQGYAVVCEYSTRSSPQLLGYWRAHWTKSTFSWTNSFSAFPRVRSQIWRFNMVCFLATAPGSLRIRLNSVHITAMTIPDLRLHSSWKVVTHSPLVLSTMTLNRQLLGILFAFLSLSCICRHLF